jgi:rhodanese-related sulfurtransferase
VRKKDDFTTTYLPGSINIPLHSLRPTDCSPFEDSTLLAQQWKELEALFGDANLQIGGLPEDQLRAKSVLVICYGGDTSRVATSVLRAKGIKADSCKGGFQAMLRWLNSSPHIPDSPPMQLSKVDSGVEIHELHTRGQKQY